jgi:hypothetical protein
MTRRYVTAQERRAIVERAKGRCEYCQSLADFATQSFSLEHIMPISKDGETGLENLALACPGCNGHKYNKTQYPDPVDGAVVPLYNPRTQRWRDHFCWNDDLFYPHCCVNCDRSCNASGTKTEPCRIGKYAQGIICYRVASAGGLKPN